MENIRIVTDNLESNRTISMPYARQISYLNNTLTGEKERLTFSGWKTSNGWKSAKKMISLIKLFLVKKV